MYIDEMFQFVHLVKVKERQCLGSLQQLRKKVMC